MKFFYVPKGSFIFSEFYCVLMRFVFLLNSRPLLFTFQHCLVISFRLEPYSDGGYNRKCPIGPWLLNKNDLNPPKTHLLRRPETMIGSRRTTRTFEGWGSFLWKGQNQSGFSLRQCLLRIVSHKRPRWEDGVIEGRKFWNGIAIAYGVVIWVVF